MKIRFCNYLDYNQFCITNSDRELAPPSTNDIDPDLQFYHCLEGVIFYNRLHGDWNPGYTEFNFDFDNLHLGEGRFDVKLLKEMISVSKADVFSAVPFTSTGSTVFYSMGPQIEIDIISGNYIIVCEIMKNIDFCNADVNNFEPNIHPYEKFSVVDRKFCSDVVSVSFFKCDVEVFISLTRQEGILKGKI